MRKKQKMPKLCIGLKVCHIPLLGSSVTHTLISVNKKIISTRISIIVEAKIYIIWNRYYL